MKINDDHLYHGAALTQIAEHPLFTAINAFKVGPKISRSAFRVNENIGVYLKYCTYPKGRFDEYTFQFTTEHIRELERLADKIDHVFVALVCVHGRQICCLPYDDLVSLIERRRNAKGENEDQYTILVTMPSSKEFRVYVNAPGMKKTMEGEPLLVPRKAFPDKLFQ